MMSLRQYLDRNYEMPEADLLKFRRLQFTNEHLRFCSQLTSKYKVLPWDTSDHFNLDDPCNCLTAYNDHIKCYRDREALGFLNKAVACNLETPEQEDTFMTRAYVCFDLEEYEACLVNLRLASDLCGKELRFGPNDKTLESLAARMIHLTRDKVWLTRKFHEKEKAIGIPFKFGEESRPPLHFAFNEAIRLRRAEFSPQTVYSTSALAAGTALGVDRAICSALYGPATNRRCTQCHRECPFTMIPCVRLGCTAMFCDVRCLGGAFEAEHRYECNIMPFLRKHEHCRLVVRLVVETFQNKNDVSDMMTFRQTCSLYHDNVFEYAELPNMLVPTNHYAKLAYALTHQTRSLSIEDRFYFARLTSVVYSMLKRMTYLVADLFRNRHQRRFLRHFIFDTAMMLSECGYLHEMQSGMRFDGEQTVVQPVSWCLYPVMSMLQHSCTPNTVVVPFLIDRVALFALRPIAAGEPLTIDRTVGVPGASVARHRQTVRSVLGTDCACPDDGPQAMPFPNELSPCKTDVAPEALWDQRSPEMQRLFSLPRQRVLNLVDQTAAFLQNNDHLYPCRELWQAQQCFELCVRRIIGPRLVIDAAHDELADERRAAEACYVQWWQTGVRRRNSAYGGSSAPPTSALSAAPSTLSAQRRMWPTSSKDTDSQRSQRSRFSRYLEEEVSRKEAISRRCSAESSTDSGTVGSMVQPKRPQKKRTIDVHAATLTRQESALFGSGQLVSSSSSFRFADNVVVEGMVEADQAAGTSRTRRRKPHIRHVPKTGVKVNSTDSGSD